MPVETFLRVDTFLRVEKTVRRIETPMHDETVSLCNGMVSERFHTAGSNDSSQKGD
jgi:hypothetical protein